MHHKDIKVQIRKQLKTNYPNWKRLSRKEKKAIAKMVLDEVVKDYNFSQEHSAPSVRALKIFNITQVTTTETLQLWHSVL